MDTAHRISELSGNRQATSLVESVIAGRRKVLEWRSRTGCRDVDGLPSGGPSTTIEVETCYRWPRTGHRTNLGGDLHPEVQWLKRLFTTVDQNRNFRAELERGTSITSA
ncbi:hypothetical protein EVAR_5420_1 [Eumeta japonica]|uniref:Uncharacterized protein n=1 Tax=Eumeta variegata TaxID=151549 RepID=A0A4C1T9L5_EUMVA|nr:hypothetical protein EVAR_5420_1 [Eumeta japonica]